MTLKIPVIFERGVFRPLVEVPFNNHRKFTLSLKLPDTQHFSHKELKKIESLFNQRGGKAFCSAKASLAFHRKLCEL